VYFSSIALSLDNLLDAICVRERLAAKHGAPISRAVWANFIPKTG
jgi:hypothetical protein